jgi:putative transposase
MKIEYHNLYVHIVFVTKHRFPFISESIRGRIEKYMTGIVNHHSSRLYAIYANPEHVHMLVSRSPIITEEQLLTRVADSTRNFIIENKLCDASFAWQESASAFSVSKDHIDRVCKYILNQKEHHNKVTFEQEYGAYIEFYQQTLKWQPGGLRSVEDSSQPAKRRSQ